MTTRADPNPPEPLQPGRLLSAAQARFRDEVREIAQRVLRPGAAERDRPGVFAREPIDELGRLGLMGLLVPAAYGGRGSDFVSYCLAIEELAAVDAGVSTTVHVHSLGATLLLARHGTEAQRRALLPRLASGAAIGSFLLTEPQAGSDSSALATTAIRDGDDYVLDGHKHLITSGRCAETVLLWAVTNPAAGRKGITAFIVPTATPGYRVMRVEQKMGQHSSETVEVALEGCRVPAANILGRLDDGYRLAMSGLADGRIAIAAQAVGIARAAYEAALRYARTREAYGQPLIKLQSIAFRLAEMATQLEVARTFYCHAAALRDDGQGAMKEASMAKLFASEMAERVCSDALQVHGGNGYLREYEVERHCRDVRATRIYEGTGEIQRVIIAREIERAPEATPTGRDPRSG